MTHSGVENCGDYWHNFHATLSGQVPDFKTWAVLPGVIP